MNVKQRSTENLPFCHITAPVSASPDDEIKSKIAESDEIKELAASLQKFATTVASLREAMNQPKSVTPKGQPERKTSVTAESE